MNLGGGALNENDVIKEAIKTLSKEQLVDLMPPDIVRAYNEKQKTTTLKFEALQVFIRLWKSYVSRLRSLVSFQNKIAVCQFFGTFAPIGLLIFEADQTDSTQNQPTKVGFVASSELTKQGKLTFEENLPINIS